MFARILLFAVVLVGCSRPLPEKVVGPAVEPLPLDNLPGLHNVQRLSPKLYSGSSPEGAGGFRSLRELGIVTIVSVDGGKPEVELARQHGMKYAHLPVGYDGVPRDVALRIARVVRDSPGPVYVHCHHGKHRGPAAAIAAERCLNPQCDAQAALAFLTKAGTDPRYKGLFADVDRGGVATQAELDRAQPIPEVATVADLTRLMVDVDERWDRLKASKAAGWKLHEDAAHEATQLVELYREAARLPSAPREEFGKAELAAVKLEAALRAKNTEQIAAAFSECASACTRCHAAHRDSKPGQ